MPSLTDLLIVVAVAFAAPFVLGMFPGARLPSVVLEIVAGIVIGPSLLGIVEVDQAIEVIALIGLGFVLFLAGLEIEFEKLRGQVLRLTALGFAPFRRARHCSVSWRRGSPRRPQGPTRTRPSVLARRNGWSSSSGSSAEGAPRADHAGNRERSWSSDAAARHWPTPSMGEPPDESLPRGGREVRRKRRRPPLWTR